tara:strand:+ start:121 stop:984 length:864 start_codon:yes stop_codon:yes gene_type:complete
MANVTVSTAANFIPEMWRDAILDYAERKFQLRNQVTDFSSMVSGGGDVLNIPKIDEETAAAKSAGSAVTYSANTDGVRQLTIDQHHYEAKRIEDIVRVQESADLFNAYAKSMGYALAKKVENFLATTLKGNTGNNTDVATDNILLPAELRGGLEKFLDANHDYTDGETYLYVNPKVYMGLMGQGDFTEAQKRGDGVNPLVSGAVMEIYGMPVYASTDWSESGTDGTQIGTAFKKEAVYFGQQIAPRVQSAYDIDHLATSVVADVLFGAVLSHAANSTAAGIVNFLNP